MEEEKETLKGSSVILENGEEIHMDEECKKLTKSRKDRMICGVCGGVGKYFNVDATVIRLLFLLFGFTGTGILAYFIAAAVIPEGE